MDEETEVLTANVWKTVHDLRVGDEVLTLNHETGMSEWLPVLEVCVFPGKRQTRISQSLKNPANVVRIDASLRSVYGPPVDRHGITPEPRWRRDVDEGRNVRFTLNTAARKVLTDVAPGRVVQPWFLRSLTQAQLGLFIRISMVADNSGPTRLHQKDRRQAEAFQFAAILTGHAAPG